MGKTRKSKAQCSACSSLCATLGSWAAHRQQTVGQMELFIQLYTLFGRCMSFSDWETICCVSQWIANFELCSSEAGGYIFSFYRPVFFVFFFSRPTQRQDAPIKLLIIPLGQLSHSWTPFWPSKWKNYLESNDLKLWTELLQISTSISSTVQYAARAGG